ncbi:hypothetical protein FDB88_05775 [Clostridium sporogenes]|uniref:hypothetical protein n=1 Tax=Clostridium sporogenes TaxID=1509 RepID=UPI0013D38CFE|nr:hypothetical protein [Clostridium sporogenes]NFM16718.1 hypothetical protein [Clostridium sporogenes]
MKVKLLLKYLEYAALSHLKSKDYKVLLYILPELIEKPSVKINQNNIANELGISKSEVSKGLKRLEYAEIISFVWLSKRKKTVQLEDYTIDELDEMITEKMENNVFLSEE